MKTDMDTELEQHALDHVPLMVRDLDGRILLWTTGMQKHFGYAADEARGQLSHDLLATAFPKPRADLEAELFKQDHWTGELEHQRRDGARVDAVSAWLLIRWDDGAPRAVIEFSYGVGRESNAQADCRRLAGIVEGSHDAIISKTLDGIVTSWNKGAEEIFGYCAAEMIDRPVAMLLPPNQAAEEERILERLRRGERIESYETVRLRKDGSEVHVSLSVSPIIAGNGQIIGASKIARNITEQKMTRARLDEVQSELVHISRLTAMGEMSAALAHELNQPLTAVANYLSGVQRLLQDLPEPVSRKIGEGVSRAVEQTLRCGEIIRRLREFVSRGETTRRVESISKLVEEAIELALLGSGQFGVNVVFDLGGEADLIVVDKIQLQQVLLNLIRNALEAMAGCERRVLSLSSRPSTDGMVEIRIADTGVGLADDVAARLFQPFVTTKANGMGVGLSICRTIIEAQGGRIWATANPAGGTVFHLTAPAAPADAPVSE